MELKLERFAKRDGYTIGRLSVDGAYFSDTLEDTDRGLNDTMSEEEIARIKVYGQTAIPTGRYEVRLTYSPKFAQRTWAKPFSGKVPELVGVKGFSGIRIHPLNTAADSLGCIGVGRNTAVGKISQSTKYFTELTKKLRTAVQRRERTFITIV